MVENIFIDLTKRAKIGWGTVIFAGAIGLINLGIDDVVIKATTDLTLGGMIGGMKWLTSSVKAETIAYSALACQLVSTKYELYQGVQQLYQTISNYF